MKLQDWFKEKSQLVDENSKMKKGKSKVEEKYYKALEELENINSKYTTLLEQKSENFDLYLKYQKQCEELAKDKKELKKQVAELTEMNNSLAEINSDLTANNGKLSKKITRLEKSGKAT